jgi:collagen type IV alpha-3-binding protein
MCHYFYDPQYRNDWETTLEDVQILEKVSPDTLVFLQTHKRIWPASQRYFSFNLLSELFLIKILDSRDALFWSHMRKIEDDFDQEAKDVWIVCNHSTQQPEYPVSN